MAEQNKRNEDFLDYETRFNQDTVALKKLKITEIHSEQLQGKTTIRLEIDSFTIWLTGRENLTKIDRGWNGEIIEDLSEIKQEN
ncbi:hypothetical protein B9Z55_000560 [Caenorhabditis nigoni]|uniref:Uncharacterized protein n=1 Tax=Caenorhabditis nigoni TaxID=1611254 RepID=A0A2G5VTS3_9PELO|nr:hypothetical protein B9Z55_000560 [Caenorhabditis nigoni]